MNDQEFGVDRAREAAAEGRLGPWVRAFLESPGSDNGDLADELEQEIRDWAGPFELPFDHLHRLAGPPDQPTIGRLRSDDLEQVEEMTDELEDGWQPPPLVVSINGDQLVVEDGNHRIEGLRQSGRSRYWAVVGFRDDAEREWFDQRWGDAVS